MTGTDPSFAIETCTGAALEAALPALARLRVAVFREWPYLYDGDIAEEADHLRKRLAIPGQAVILARITDSEIRGEIVGAATCSRLTTESDSVRAPFTAIGMDTSGICYFGESVLLARYRGQGIGVAFFAAREAHARALGCTAATFCAVRRPDDHPLRPANAVKLDEFWTHRGYARLPGVVALMRWKDIGGESPVTHEMDFWWRDLRSSAPDRLKQGGQG